MRLNVTIPVRNEEKQLRDSVHRLWHFLKEHLPDRWSLEFAIADNGSTDGPLAVAKEPARTLSPVRVWHIPRPGRGLALKLVWMHSKADVLTYMDVDLSTDIEHVLDMVAAFEGGADLVVGSRLSPCSVVTRGLKREVISRCYNRLVQAWIGTRVPDLQCGFKGLTKRAAGVLLSEVVDNGFFFDTELILAAEARGMRIESIPVRWIDDPNSRVNITRTALRDLSGLFRVWRSGGHTS